MGTIVFTDVSRSYERAKALVAETNEMTSLAFGYHRIPKLNTATGEEYWAGSERAGFRFEGVGRQV